MSFQNGQKVHLYVKGHDLFEATVTNIGSNKKGSTISVSFSQGSLDDLELSAMYNEKGDPQFVEHPGLKGMGDEVSLDPSRDPRARHRQRSSSWRVVVAAASRKNSGDAVRSPAVVYRCLAGVYGSRLRCRFPGGWLR